jgi:phosphoenolpyruvate carboxylase
MLHGYVDATFILQELFEPLHLMYTSLLSTGDESTANHKLLDTLRQV